MTRWRSLMALTGPADHQARVEIEQRRQGELAAAADHELRRVADPALVRRLGPKVLAEHIRRDRLIVVTHGRALEPLPHTRRQALRLFQPDHALATHPVPLGLQVTMKAGAAVGAATCLMRGSNQHAELLITPRVGRGGTTLPRVESASGDVEYLTEVRERHAGLLRLDERESYSLSLATKAAAFFRTSRSTRRRRFSLRSRRSSSRSSVVKPRRPCVRSARARSTQLRNADSVRSRSRATCPTLRSSSSTSRTAPALNSSSNCRRGRRFLVGCTIGDIVSAFRNVSTKPDQTQLHSFVSRSTSTINLLP